MLPSLSTRIILAAVLLLGLATSLHAFPGGRGGHGPGYGPGSMYASANDTAPSGYGPGAMHNDANRTFEGPMAGYGGYGPGTGPGMDLAGVFTDEELEAMAQAHAEHMQTRFEQRQEMHTLMSELEVLLAAETPDSEAIELLRQQISALMDQMLADWIEYRLNLSTETGLRMPVSGFGMGYGHRGYLEGQ